MKLALSRLGREQLSSGGWRGTIPFYPTFNALSRLNLPQADRQFKKALNKIAKTQNKDGSWGRSSRKFDSYLVVDALQRKGIDLKFA
jgi:hypothetical protein